MAISNIKNPSKWTLLATSNPSSVNNVSFTSISNSYSKLLIAFEALYASTADQLNVRLNNDTGNNYSYSYVNYVGNLDSQGYASKILLGEVYTNTSPAGGYLLINGANDIYKTITYNKNSAQNYVAYKGEANWHNSNEINRIDLFLNTHSLSATSVKLYGSN